MFEFLREWTKSTAVKRQETLNAYLDGELASQDRVAFERLLADDAVLRQELADRELIKSQLRQLPRVDVPRNFILDASKYRKPVKRPLITYYPVLRGATALTAVIFIFTLGWGMMGSGESYNAAPAQEFAVEMVTEEMADETAVEEMEIPVEAEMVEMERMLADGIVEAEEASAEAVADAVKEFADDAAASAPVAAGVPVEIEEAEEESIIEESIIEESIVEEDANAEDEALFEALTMEVPVVEEAGAGADGETVANEGMDLDMVDDVEKSADVEEEVLMRETAVATKTAVFPAPLSIQSESAPSPALTSTQIAQIGLFILFSTLLALTLYARRQR